MKRLGVFLLPLDGMPVHRRVTPSIKSAGTHLYPSVERGTVRVKCLAQEHNAMSPVRARTRIFRSGDERSKREAIASRRFQFKTFNCVNFLEDRNRGDMTGILQAYPCTLNLSIVVLGILRITAVNMINNQLKGKVTRAISVSRLK